MEVTWRVISGEGEGGMREKVQGISSIRGRYKIDRGRLRVVYIGNGEAKELLCMTHGYELREENAGGRKVRGREVKGGGKWENCNSIISKIYLKKLSDKKEKITKNEKKKIKTMNIKMAINSQQSTILSKKQTEQTSRRETES